MRWRGCGGDAVIIQLGAIGELSPVSHSGSLSKGPSPSGCCVESQLGCSQPVPRLLGLKAEHGDASPCHVPSRFVEEFPVCAVMTFWTVGCSCDSIRSSANSRGFNDITRALRAARGDPADCKWLIPDEEGHTLFTAPCFPFVLHASQSWPSSNDPPPRRPSTCLNQSYKNRWPTCVDNIFIAPGCIVCASLKYGFNKDGNSADVVQQMYLLTVFLFLFRLDILQRSWLIKQSLSRVIVRDLNSDCSCECFCPPWQHKEESFQETFLNTHFVQKDNKTTLNSLAHHSFCGSDICFTMWLQQICDMPYLTKNFSMSWPISLIITLPAGPNVKHVLDLAQNASLP